MSKLYVCIFSLYVVQSTSSHKMVCSLSHSFSSTDDSDSVHTLTWRFFRRPLFRSFDCDFGSKLHVGSISHSSNAFAFLSSSWYFPKSKLSSFSTNRTASLFCFARAVRLEAEGPVPQVLHLL